MPQMLKGPFLPAKSGKAKSLVVLLHGYGSSGDDLIAIGREWAREMPDTAFAAPHAPDVCEAWAQGYQWFQIRSPDGVVRKDMDRKELAKAPAALLNAYLDAELQRLGLDDSQLAVGGFSQGSMMAMYTMPRRKKACAAVIGYSGILIDAAGLKEEGIVKPPMLVVHGDADEVVPPAFLTEAEAAFAAAGFDAEIVMRRGLGHSIDQFGIVRGLQFLQDGFARSAQGA